ncbi:hypothetical protein FG386_002326 [Cryptosporidium ryanae]|uniref:uncharacterized protein n=1 Tax=Cryptosporidium ryanae TaxID=515981 RepID=UPI00351A3B51|nr:hypothetical protein FG386_002326 [Cryptosporidium ryanae]
MDSIPLLKSIDYKDPSLNWNIDVSAELEKYLSAIELFDEDISYSQNIEVGNNSQQGSNNNQGNYHQLFNFVEAALIIQNSTSLYSRKIEHLHSLVYETFNLLSTGKSQQNDAIKGINNGENATSTNDNSNKSSNLEKNVFLMSMLDVLSVPIELLQPGRNINMQLDQYNKSKCVDDSALRCSSYSSYIGISNLGNSISLPQYRIDQNTNALFLDEADLGHFSSQLANEDRNMYINNMFVQEDEDHTEIENGDYNHLSESLSFDPLKNNDDNRNGELNAYFDYNSATLYGDNTDNDGDFTGMNDGNCDYDLRYSDVKSEKNLVTCGKLKVKSDNNVFRKRIPKEDFWLHLDEHMKIGKDKPLKESKTHKNPSKLYTISLESLINKLDLIDFIDEKGMTSYILGEYCVDSVKFENEVVPYFNDLKIPKLNVEKLSSSFDCQNNNYLRSLEGEFTACANEWRKYHARSNFSQLERKNPNNNSTHGKNYVENEIELEYSNYMDGIEADDILAPDQIEDVQHGENNETSFGEQNGENGEINDYYRLNENENTTDINNEHYIGTEGGDESYEDASELHEKINIWSEHVEPLLRMQKNRPEFNIYEEGKKIISDIISKNDTISPIDFNKLTKGQQRWQVCRSFLATLMLANSKEVEIIDSESVFSVMLTSKNNDDDVELSESNNKVTKVSYPKKKKPKNNENIGNVQIHVNKKKKRS